MDTGEVRKLTGCGQGQTGVGSGRVGQTSWAMVSRLACALQELKEEENGSGGQKSIHRGRLLSSIAAQRRIVSLGPSEESGFIRSSKELQTGGTPSINSGIEFGTIGRAANRPAASRTDVNGGPPHKLSCLYVRMMQAPLSLRPITHFASFLTFARDISNPPPRNLPTGPSSPIRNLSHAGSPAHPDL